MIDTEPVYPTLHDFMFTETKVVEKFEPIDLSISQTVLPMKTPKAIYFEKVGEEKDLSLCNDLKTLYDFGFVEFEVNK